MSYINVDFAKILIFCQKKLALMFSLRDFLVFFDKNLCLGQ